MSTDYTAQREIMEARAAEEAIVAEGAYLTPKEDGNGTPIGQSPDDLHGQLVVVDPYHAEQGFDSFSFRLDGVNDPDMAAAVKTYQTPGGPRSVKDHLAATLQVLQATAAAKKTRDRAAGHRKQKGPDMTPESQTDTEHRPAPARVGPVIWDMGQRGRQYAFYDRAFIHDQSLILATDVSGGRDAFIPPVGGEGETFQVKLPDDSLPTVRVYSVGLMFPFEGFLLCVFPIERS